MKIMIGIDMMYCPPLEVEWDGWLPIKEIPLLNNGDYLRLPFQIVLKVNDAIKARKDNRWKYLSEEYPFLKIKHKVIDFNEDKILIVLGE